MMALRRRSGWRPWLAALVLLALAVKAMVPAGYMPGTSLAAPIVLCPDQAPMPAAMAMHGDGHHAPSNAPHGGPDHPCAFAGLGVAALAVPFEAPAVLPVRAEPDFSVATALTIIPGRGLAAPPPPSHAPPQRRA